MKTNLTTTAKNLILVSALVIMLSTTLLAQDERITERSIQDLKTGIISENLGLRKSSIYFAGLYGIEETVDMLAEQLSKEEDAQVKILIALSLYRIGNEKAISAVEKMASVDKDVKVRRMGNAILNQFRKDTAEGETTVSSLK